MSASVDQQLPGDLVRVDGAWRLLGHSGEVFEFDGDDPRLVDPGPGLLDELRRQVGPQRDPILQPAEVAVLGGGLLALTVALHLAEAGHRLLLCAPAAPDPVVHPRSRRASAAEAIADAVAGRVAAAPPVRIGDHWTHTRQYLGTVVVVAADTMTPDRAVLAHLTRDGVAHLPVLQHAARASVGSVVVPGQTCCQCCRDLTLADADPRWPRTVEAIANRSARQRPQLCRVAAAWTGQLLTQHLAGLHDSSVIETFADGTTRIAAWTPHPDCPCGAAGVVTE